MFTSTAVFWMIQAVLLPVLLAGLIILFLYGIVNYFVIGASDDDRKDMGRNQLLAADAGFISILIVVLVIQGVFSLNISSPTRATSTDAGFNIPDTPQKDR